LWCLEKFIKYVNYNAYTIVNIEGLSFFPSAKKAFNIIVENSVRIAVINSVGDFMLFLAKISVTLLTLLVAVFLLDVPLNDVGHEEILNIANYSALNWL
jgi:solute carrier family 44 protein 1 (choline transporter-like protein)